MRHRIFIAINLPEEIKRKLSEYEGKWPELPIRWTKEENLHITLIFLGYLSDEELLEICKITKEVASRNQPFSINLNKICYGPRTGPPATREGLASRPKKMLPRSMSPSGSFPRSSHFSIKSRTPRMIWVNGEKSREFTALKDDIEKSLGTSERVSFSPEKRVFSPHITLGRIRAWEFRQIEPEERPEVDEDIDLSFEVNSIEVMESQLKRGGPNYTVLESAPLKS